MDSGDGHDRDAAFDGLYRASGVTLSDEERDNLRRAYDTLSSFAERMRATRGYGDRPLSLFVPRRRHR